MGNVIYKRDALPPILGEFIFGHRGVVEGKDKIGDLLPPQADRRLQDAVAEGSVAAEKNALPEGKAAAEII